MEQLYVHQCKVDIQFTRNDYIYARPKMFIIWRWNEIFGTNLVFHVFQ